MSLSDRDKIEIRKVAIKALADSNLDIPAQITFHPSGSDAIKITVQKRKGFSLFGKKTSSSIRNDNNAKRAILDVVKKLWR